MSLLAVLVVFVARVAPPAFSVENVESANPNNEGAKYGGIQGNNSVFIGSQK
ncbi:hypothetical protein [uncultured Roseobacter sp.]|uniref:hypothetical protein n=1 Tax=uncultured Roseobacter sp. TaxID=114847 RepID=UPI002611F883|nr:hypothetical protein [uncultured Roseobacter sp.]